MSYEYMTAGVNSSPTICGQLGEDIANAPHKAVAFNDNGDLVLATDGATAVGVLISTTNTDPKEGEDVTVQIRHIGLVEAGEAIPKGALVTVNDQGQAIVAEAGASVLGRAFSQAESEGELVQVNICPV